MRRPLRAGSLRGEPVGQGAVEDSACKLGMPGKSVLPESGARFRGVHVDAEPKERRRIPPGPGAHVEHLLSGLEQKGEQGRDTASHGLAADGDLFRVRVVVCERAPVHGCRLRLPQGYNSR